MEKFLRDYLESTLESLKEEYNVDEITDEDKKYIIANLMYNDTIWSALFNALCYEIRDFKKDEEEE